MKTKTILSLILTGVLALGVACEKKEEAATGDQAEAVEAEGEAKEGEEAAEKAEEADEGAAAKEGEEADKAEGEETATATVGEPAPDFELKDASGKTHKLSDYKGKIVVLEWTNPGCPYVVRHKEEEKTMTKTHEAVGGAEEVVWLAVDTTNTVTAESAKKSKEEWGFDMPVLLDADGKVGKMYDAKTTPHMYVVDKEGVLRYRGAIDDDPRGKKKVEERTNYVTQAVQALKEGKDVPKSETKPYGCSVKYGS
ncbi:thioredoxin family protein [Persicimonas caeni]|uniref:Thioredoxin family protein n=1 Tax=Persicimonas caeni TaxID=2292766 RepID=A0A4Y6PU25_PERCE|nr:thioredoxin family protein [Persicimonas caeni]QDG51743.1 thioredoxin family protein [Persicimonas caeni]QED32964.1 thioredoxin family protein [Persicimonas caeni]